MRLLFICLISVVAFARLYGQVEVTYDSVSLYKSDVLTAVVYVQNFGPTTRVGASCQGQFGQNAELCEFRLKYEYIPTRMIVSHPASGITVKTILGPVEMDRPFYKLGTTGTNAEEWEVLFTGVPNESGNLVVLILEKEYSFGDMPGASEARRQRDLRELEERRQRDAQIVALVEVGNSMYSAGDYSQAVRNYQSAMKLTDTLSSQLASKLAHCFAQLGKESYGRRDYVASINLYTKALTYDASKLEECRGQLSDSYMRVAEDELAVKRYENAGQYFRNAVAQDPSLRESVNARLRKIRRSPFVTGVMSLVPGGGQIRNGEYRKAALHFGAFAVLVGISAGSLAEADRRYSSYLKATDAGSASSLYDKTSKAWGTCIVSGVASVVVMAWSIRDAYRSASSFNDHFDMIRDQATPVSFTPFYSDDLYGFRVCIRF